MKTPSAIDVLVDEHRAVLRVVQHIEDVLRDLNSVDGAPPDAYALLGRQLCFLDEFADRYHHHKEEALLFEALIQRAGFSSKFGPVRIMLDEHAAGREHLQRASSIVLDVELDLLDAAKFRTLQQHLQDYIQLERAHIAKENAVLYRMAGAHLDDDALNDIGEAFVAYDESLKAKGAWRRLEATSAAVGVDVNALSGDE